MQNNLAASLTAGIIEPMKALSGTPLVWRIRGDRVVLYRRFRFSLICFAISWVLAFLAIYYVIFIPVMILINKSDRSPVVPIAITVTTTLVMGAAAYGMNRLGKWVPDLHYRCKSLRIGRGVRLIVERDTLIQSTGSGGTMPGGWRTWVKVTTPSQPKPRRLVPVTGTTPDLHDINDALI